MVRFLFENHETSKLYSCNYTALRPAALRSLVKSTDFSVCRAPVDLFKKCTW